MALLGAFMYSCIAKRKVTYGKRNSPASVQTKPKVYSQKEITKGQYALPEDDGKFMRYEINSVEAYIDFFSKTAQLEMKAYGIPASITLAQGLLESGLGKGELAMKSNNHFGIKCHTTWTGDSVSHDDDEIGECFRKYNHPMYSYRDHSIFLSSRARYASLFELGATDYRAWAKGLQKAGYATDRKYPEKLISLIERYDLHRFDNVVVDSPKQDEAAEVLWVPNESRELETEVTEVTESEITKMDSPRQANVQVSKSINHTVVRGDSLWSLSRKYGVSISELRTWNELSSNNLSIGQQLVVKKN